MVNVIDSLVVTLGLDPTKFTQGQDAAVVALKKTEKAATATADTVDKAQAKTDRAMVVTSDRASRTAEDLKTKGKQGAGFFDQITSAGLKLLAVVGGGMALKSFITDTMTSAAGVGRLSTTLGVNTEKFAAWGQVVKQFGGGSAAAAQNSMGGLITSLSQYKIAGTPSPAMAALSRALNISPEQMKGENFDSLLHKLARGMHSMSPTDAQAFGQMVGLDNGSIKILSGGEKALDEWMATVKKQGVVTKDQAAAMMALQSSYEGVTAAADNLGRVMLTQLAPALKAVLDSITAFIEAHPTAASAIGIGASAAGAAGTWLMIKRMLGFGGKAAGAAAGGEAAAGAAGIGLLRLLLGPVGIPLALAGDTDPGATKGGAPGIVRPGGFFGRGGALERFFTGGGGGSGNGVSIPNHTADTAMPSPFRALLDSISMGESKGYNEGNPKDNQGRVLSTAHGRYQFIDSTDADVSAKTGITGQDPVSQDRKAKYLAATTYRKNTGRDLGVDAKDPDRWEGIAYALNKQWPSLPGGSQQNTTMEQWKRHMADNLAAYGPQAVATGNPATQGKIDKARAKRDAAASMAGVPDLNDGAGRGKPAAKRDDVRSLLDGLRAAQSDRVSSNSQSSTTNTSTVGTINVHTKATDARGVVHAIKTASTNGGLAMQANVGLQ